MTDAAGLHAHPHVSRPGFRDRAFDELESTSRTRHLDDGLVGTGFPHQSTNHEQRSPGAYPERTPRAPQILIDPDDDGLRRKTEGFSNRCASDRDPGTVGSDRKWTPDAGRCVLSPERASGTPRARIARG